MKNLNEYFVAYSSPIVMIMTFATEGVLCTSSELKDLEKGEHDFEWE